MDHEDNRDIVSSISHAAEMVKYSMQIAAVAFEETATKMGEYSILMKPKLYIDGNQWCAIYGDNLQDGVCGFGESPHEAMLDFDKSWNAKITLK